VLRSRDRGCQVIARRPRRRRLRQVPGHCLLETPTDRCPTRGRILTASCETLLRRPDQNRRYKRLYVNGVFFNCLLGSASHFTFETYLFYKSFPSHILPLFLMLSYRLALYCDICVVFLKYFFTYGTLNLTFLHYITYCCYLTHGTDFAGGQAVFFLSYIIFISFCFSFLLNIFH